MYLLQNYCTCFGRPSRPSSGVHKSVVVACGTDHTIWGANVFKRDQIRTDFFFSMLCCRPLLSRFIPSFENFILVKLTTLAWNCWLLRLLSVFLVVYFVASLAYGLGYCNGRPYLVTFKEACFPDSMICTRVCNYSFMYSSLLPRQYDLYKRLLLQFYVLKLAPQTV